MHGIIAIFMVVGPTERPALEVSPVPELWVIAHVGSPLIEEASRAAPVIPRKDTEPNVVSAVVISPCLTTGSTRQQVSFGQRLAIDACRIR